MWSVVEWVFARESDNLSDIISAIVHDPILLQYEIWVGDRGEMMDDRFIRALVHCWLDCKSVASLDGDVNWRKEGF